MAAEWKDTLVENLAYAAVVGFVVIILAIAAYLTETKTISFERSALGELAGRRVTGTPLITDDPAFSRVFRIDAKGVIRFGAVVKLGTRRGSALVTALLSGDGELEAVRFIGGSSEVLPFAEPTWFADFLGKGGEREYPASPEEARAPQAVSGATETFLTTSSTLGRLSEAVRNLAKEGS